MVLKKTKKNVLKKQKIVNKKNPAVGSLKNKLNDYLKVVELLTEVFNILKPHNPFAAKLFNAQAYAIVDDIKKNLMIYRQNSEEIIPDKVLETIEDEDVKTMLKAINSGRKQ